METEHWEGRKSVEYSRPNDVRGAYVRDRARIIHSATFRRLQAKTQVLGIGEGDFHRTRLTHSLEVAQVARGITYFLTKKFPRNAEELDGLGKWLPGANLIEAISLAHDLGHPPFGHGGEVALNFVMRNDGGFEGNGQTLRILTKLEAHTENFGLNLTRRTLLGILKYPVAYEAVVRRAPPANDKQHIVAKSWKPPKCYLGSERSIVDWIFEPFDKSDRQTITTLKELPSETKHGKSKYHALDTSIMELADDIAYGVHDLEDAIALGFITRQDLEELNIDAEWSIGLEIEKASLVKDLTGTGSSRKRAIGALVNAFISSTEPVCIEGFNHPLLKYSISFSEPANRLIEQLKDLVSKRVIKIPQVQTLEFRGQQIIIDLFNALESDPLRLLKPNFQELYLNAEAQEKKRVLCDYIAGMTDEYATRMYERLFMPRHGQVFDRL